MWLDNKVWGIFGSKGFILYLAFYRLGLIFYPTILSICVSLLRLHEHLLSFNLNWDLYIFLCWYFLVQVLSNNFKNLCVRIMITCGSFILQFEMGYLSFWCGDFRCRFYPTILSTYVLTLITLHDFWVQFNFGFIHILSFYVGDFWYIFNPTILDTYISRQLLLLNLLSFNKKWDFFFIYLFGVKILGTITEF